MKFSTQIKIILCCLMLTKLTVLTTFLKNWFTFSEFILNWLKTPLSTTINSSTKSDCSLALNGFGTMTFRMTKINYEISTGNKIDRLHVLFLNKLSIDTKIHYLWLFTKSYQLTIRSKTEWRRSHFFAVSRHKIC